MSATALVTSEQYLALPDEFDQNGNRIKDELIGGEIVKMPPASHQHDRVKNRIGKLLTNFLDNNRHLGLESNVEIGARVSRFDTFVPDVSVTRSSRFSDQDRILQGPPEIAIELVSRSDTASHFKAKVAAYLTNGSTSVWVVSPELKLVEVHRQGAMRELKADDRIEDPLLPGFSVPVSTFFELS
ncbi:MAG TPA: Uma2 family endonuclease [Bryobacteraceae bacterium]|nr:Uma2 family endonuclease [Bryobacteraceae bacterium]